jgi:aminopeptidase
MSLSEYEEFVFNAINKVNWKEMHKKQEKLRKILDLTNYVRIIGLGTDLKLCIRGRKAVNSAGENNIPDGEVFTSVVEDSAAGYITYSFPAVYLGKEFHEVRLEFKDGKVVKANASKGEEDLNEILNMDAGARYIGELGIGNNYKITKFTKDILFDEKIGGSIHLALGNGYSETLSKNKSGLHWDMIKDLRKKPSKNQPTNVSGGELWFDDKLVQKNGRWLIF